MSFKDNFSLYTHVNSKASWPLPPSIVFRLRAARPWIPPEWFGIGVEPEDSDVVICEAQEQENEYEEILDYDKCYVIKENEDSIYAELVEVYGLPLPNSRVQVIQYSDNPEKGIDLGVEGNSGGNSGGEGEVKRVDGVHKFASGEVVLGGNKRSSCFKKWSPFSKHKDPTKLFY